MLSHFPASSVVCCSVISVFFTPLVCVCVLLIHITHSRLDNSDLDLAYVSQCR